MFLTFTNSLMLVGIAGAVVPLVLHLLSRASYRSVDWGAMLFLEGLEARQQQSTRISQWTLMLVRMAVVGLLAVALAQPMLQQWAPEADSRGAALRAAEHGRLSCAIAAVGCAAALVALLLVTGSQARRLGLRFATLAYATLAVLSAAGLAFSAQRAARWNREAQQLALEQPHSPGNEASTALRPRVNVAVLLDCSPSMEFEENGHSRFSLAQAAAKQVLAGLHRGDRASLIFLGRPQSDVELDPTPDLQSIADRIDAAHPGRDPADVARALRRAQEVLDREGKAAHDSYMICDRQALSWRDVNDYFMTRQWPELVSRAGVPTRLFVVPVGNNDADNVAIDDVQIANPPAILGQSVEIEVDVRNYGPTPRAALPLAVSINGRKQFETTVSVSANHVARVSVPLRGQPFTNAGSQVVSAEITSTGYRNDDRLDTVVEAIEPIKVLIISGDEQKDERPYDFRSESDFLRLALAPFPDVRQNPCKVDVVSDDAMWQVDLKQYQVVVLANVERFSPAEARSVEQYVYGGGGLLVAPGSLSRVQSYNDELYRDGSGILPAELEEATSSDGSEATSLLPAPTDNPVFQFLGDRPDLMLSPTVGRYFPATARGDAQVLARYTSGSPFLIDSRAGRGRVLLMTTSLDADWTTLPLSNFYLPFAQSAVRYLAAGTIPSRNLAVGEPIDVSFDQPLDEQTVRLDLPDGSHETLQITRYGGESEVRFARTFEPGVYRVHVRQQGRDRLLAFAVRGPKDESDLTQLTDQRWRELESGLRLKRIDPADRPIAAVVSGTRDGYDLWPWALAAVLILAVLEMGLARAYSREAY